MFYKIEKIDDHPCYEMQKILEVFFAKLMSGNVWNLTDQHPKVSLVHGGSTFVSDLNTLYDEILATNIFIRHTLYRQFENNNKIENLCDGSLKIENYFLWDKEIAKKIKTFYDDCYPSKLDLGIFKRNSCSIKPTKRFYQDFIQKNGHICPFCSILPHKHPIGKKRGDFDHYIDKTHYPLAALNMDNLIPMCSECNQDYKHTANILKNTNGSQRLFIYPYSLEEEFRFEVENIVSEENKWKFYIRIVSYLDPVLVINFDDVFDIKNRIQREFEKRYDAWLVEEVKRYIFGSTTVTIDGFKAHLLHVALNVIDLTNRTLEAKLLEHALYLYLGETDDEEINDIFLGSYLYDYI
ncbi:MAG: hypothetical protein Q8S36_05925 [Sulfuricurvum sp.]|nr:hypothetical protein [Sulfuricurvum sp.]